MDPKLEKELRAEAERIGKMVNEAKQDGWVFVLTLTTPGDPGYTTYISNVSALNASKVFQEVADKIKGME